MAAAVTLAHLCQTAQPRWSRKSPCGAAAKSGPHCRAARTSSRVARNADHVILATASPVESERGSTSQAAGNVVPLSVPLAQPAAYTVCAGPLSESHPALSSIDMSAVVAAVGTPSALPAWEPSAEEDGVQLGAAAISQDELEQAVHTAFEHEIENINQAVHTAFEQELEQLNQTVEQAVESALLDRSFDIRANLNTMVALTGVILYWRGIWNLFDAWLGTDNIAGNVGSVLIGFSVMLLFRIFKLPLAEFW